MEFNPSARAFVVNFRRFIFYIWISFKS